MTPVRPKLDAAPSPVALSPEGPSYAKIAMPFVTSGIAACFASCVIHPIDLAKVRLQLFALQNPGQPKPSFPAIIGGMVQKDGITSIYAGLSASLMRQAIYGTARMGLHRTFSDMLQERNGGKPIGFGEKAVAGLTGGALAVMIGTPFDVALVRMQGDTMKPVAERRGYTHVFNALARISAEEGYGALYKGLAPNVLRGMSMNVGMMACSDQAKEMMLSITGDDPKKPSLTTRIGAAASGGFFAAFLSLPFDMLKSRLQDMKPDPKTGRMPFKGLADCGMSIVSKEGPIALWTGFGAYYARCAPHAMVILLTVDEVKRVYSNVFNIQ
eukprot:CAMPEP_0205916606 /NCGR_PEP_ID=MMETSP1325-20131115/8616_1 /ASSEMBLY_ACC=CAM_ASM_000708 /TAXON_ID=236786 /ORGANISM="Florenciella sp., Strain RCC1007" /LENGTH=326 /DNA_ID=CAMNT_0053283909 /DNA_START=166 /DNA_END=1146 /DNA_ORIENTATION=+